MLVVRPQHAPCFAGNQQTGWSPPLSPGRQPGAPNRSAAQLPASAAAFCVFASVGLEGGQQQAFSVALIILVAVAPSDFASFCSGNSALEQLKASETLGTWAGATAACPLAFVVTAAIAGAHAAVLGLRKVQAVASDEGGDILAMPAHAASASQAQNPSQGRRPVLPMQAAHSHALLHAVTASCFCAATPSSPRLHRKSSTPADSSR
mmetsp:Transcript_83715/g.191049  ORF Transcript_83715/g.191049 Transcript_83715/m.191049 type:complete len:207 (-) Transcript_83715:267-887(-)